MRAAAVAVVVGLAAVCRVPAQMTSATAGAARNGRASLPVLGPSTPEKAMDEYLRLTKRGGQLKEFEAVLTKNNYAMLALGVAMEAAEKISAKTGAMPTNKPDLASLQVPPGEDKYAAVSLVKKQATADRAFLAAKVTYNKTWRKEMEEGEDANDNATAPTVMNDGEPGEGSEWPFHVNGEGYVSFLFVKQDGSWRYHKSYAARRQVDFTPLLTSDNLDNGLTISMSESDETPPLPTTAPAAPLSGVLAGKPWKGVFARPSWFGSKDETLFGLNVLEHEESGFSAGFQQPHLMLKLPKKEGTYPLSGTFNVTFFDPPGNNVCATEGSMKVLREGNTYKVGLVAYADKFNNASGTFSYVVSTGAVASAGAVSKKPGAPAGNRSPPADAGAMPEEVEKQMKAVAEALGKAMGAGMQAMMEGVSNGVVGTEAPVRVPDAYADLRKTYDRELEKIRTGTRPGSRERIEQTTTLARHYGKALDARIAKLAAEGKAEEAEVVRQERDREVLPAAAPKPQELPSRGDSKTAATRTAPPAAGMTPREPAHPSGRELCVKAFIDGTDVLKVKGNELWYEHKGDALPGKWNGNSKPTYVNKREWMPEWEGPVSRPFENVQPQFLPKPGATVSIAHTYGRGNAVIVERPSEKNDQTLSLQLSDPDGGADWLEVVVRW